MRSSSRFLSTIFVGALGAPVLLAPAVDYFAAFDLANVVPPAQIAEGGSKRIVYAYYGNQGSGDGKPVHLLLRAQLITGSDSVEVCSRAASVHLRGGTASQVMAFTLFYPRGNRVSSASAKPREYVLFASATQPQYQQPEDAGNTENNEAWITITAPGGGTASCSRVVNIPIPPNVLRRP